MSNKAKYRYLFSLSLEEVYRVQNGSGVHPASYPMGTRDSFPGDKAAEAWSRGQRMSGAILPLPQYASMAWCSVKAQELLLQLSGLEW